MLILILIFQREKIWGGVVLELLHKNLDLS